MYLTVSVLLGNKRILLWKMFLLSVNLFCVIFVFSSFSSTLTSLCIFQVKTKTKQKHEYKNTKTNLCCVVRWDWDFSEIVWGKWMTILINRKFPCSIGLTWLCLIWRHLLVMYFKPRKHFHKLKRLPISTICDSESRFYRTSILEIAK